MDSRFLRRFQLSGSIGGLYDTPGVPVNKQIKPSQLHQATAFSSTGKSVISPRQHSFTPSRVDIGHTHMTSSHKYSYSDYLRQDTPPQLRAPRHSGRRTLDGRESVQTYTPRSELVGSRVPRSSLYSPFRQHINKHLPSFGSPANYAGLSAMGGLGPNLGTDEWKAAKGKLDRRKEYSNAIRTFNTKY